MRSGSAFWPLVPHPDGARGQVAEQPSGERSFYASDPWGNRFCIVQRGTEYRGGLFTFPLPSATPA